MSQGFRELSLKQIILRQVAFLFYWIFCSVSKNMHCYFRIYFLCHPHVNDCSFVCLLTKLCWHMSTSAMHFPVTGSQSLYFSLSVSTRLQSHLHFCKPFFRPKLSANIHWPQLTCSLYWWQKIITLKSLQKR